MTSFSKKLWLAISLILIAIGGILFQHFVYRGTLHIQGIEPPFTVTIEDWGTEECSALPCRISISPGEWKIQAEKEGYAPAIQIGNVSLQTETPLVFALVKTPEIFPYTGKMPILQVYTPPEKNTLFLSGNYSFSEGALYHHREMLTTFPVDQKIGVASDEVGRGLWAFSPTELYFVSSGTAQKTLAWRGPLEAIRPLPGGNILLLSHTKVLFLTPGKEALSIPSQFLPNIKGICQTSNSEIIGLQTTSRGTEIALWDTKANNVHILSSLKNFVPEKFQYLSCIAPHTVVLVFTEGDPITIIF